MMKDLSEKYGKDVSFKDDQLFDEITAMTYPEIGEFFAKYVYGNEPLPYTEIFARVGIDLKAGTSMENTLVISNSNITIAQHNGEQRIAMGNVSNLDEVGQELGLESGDIIMEMNGKTFPPLGPELQAFVQEQQQLIPDLETFTMKVIREVDGEQKEIELSAKYRKVEVDLPPTLNFKEDATEEQKQLRMYWLEPAK